MNEESKSLGFTLIELLVVVSIISLLSSSILAAVQNARMRGRDAKRAADIRQLYDATQLFYAKYGAYPNCLQYLDCDYYDPTTNGYADTSWNKAFMGFLTLDGEIKNPPLDPVNASPWGYLYQGSGPVSTPAITYMGRHYWYILATCFESPSPPKVYSLPGSPSSCFVLGE